MEYYLDFCNWKEFLPYDIWKIFEIGDTERAPLSFSFWKTVGVALSAILYPDKTQRDMGNNNLVNGTDFTGKNHIVHQEKKKKT